MHIFLQYVAESERPSYIKVIRRTYENCPKSQWRTKSLLARNLHKYVELFDIANVQEYLLPMFIQFAADSNAAVSEAVTNALAPLLAKFEEQGNTEQLVKIIKLVN